MNGWSTIILPGVEAVIVSL